MDKVEILTQPPLAETQADEERQGNLLQDYERRFALPRNEEENCAKGWIRSDERFDPVLEIKVCETFGRYCVEVKVPSLFEDQTTSWIRIVSGVEKLCQRNHADPRRRKSFGETRCKSETNIETVRHKEVGREEDAEVPYDRIV